MTIGIKWNTFIKGSVENVLVYPDIVEEMFGVTTDGSVFRGKNGTRPDLVAIFLSQVENGLVQVNIIGDWTK